MASTTCLKHVSRNICSNTRRFSTLLSQQTPPWQRPVQRMMASTSAESQHKVYRQGVAESNRAMTDVLQLLAADLEEADPTVFGILQKVCSRLILILRGNSQGRTAELEDRRKCGRSILSTSSRQRTSLPRQYSMLWVV